MSRKNFWNVTFGDAVGIVVLGIIGLSVSFLLFSLGWTVLN